MKNLIHATRNPFRSTPRLILVMAAVVAVVLGLLLGPATTPPASEAQGYTETVWSATMTVGFSQITAGTRVYGYATTISDSQLSPNTFRLGGQSHTVVTLVENEVLSGNMVTERKLVFSTPMLTDAATLYLDGDEYGIEDATYDDTRNWYVWILTDDLDWSAGDTVQVRLDAELQPPHGKGSVVGRITVAMDGDPDDGWTNGEFADDGQTGKAQWVFHPQWYVFALQNDREYIVEVDTESDSEDPRLFIVHPASNHNWHMSKSTKRKDMQVDLGNNQIGHNGGQTNVVINNTGRNQHAGDHFVRVDGANGFDEATEAYRIRVRDVTPEVVSTNSLTFQESRWSWVPHRASLLSLLSRFTGGPVNPQPPGLQIAEPKPLAAAFMRQPESHGGSPFTVTLGFTEVVPLTEATLRANLSVTGGQLTTVAQDPAYPNRNWKLTIAPNQLETVTATLPETTDCAAANAICTAGGKPLKEIDPLQVTHYVIPRVTTVEETTGPGDNSTWDTDETANFEVRFNKVMTVSGPDGAEPTLNIRVGGTSRVATYVGGSGTDTLTFSHQVSAADAGTTGMEAVDNGIVLGETEIKDDVDQHAVLTFEFHTWISTSAPPIRALFKGLPANHDEDDFTFEIKFSDAPNNLSYRTFLGDDQNPSVLSVTNGTVDAARRLQSGSNQRWEITIAPSGSDDVSVTLPVNKDCKSTRTICKEARPLRGPVTATIPESAPQVEEEQGEAEAVNNVATGAPAITGPPQVGQTLSADTSGISDDDGTDNAVFNHQWMRSDGGTDTDITGAIGSSYTLVSDDRGQTIKVRVSFTDDAGNDESLTSAATAAVEARPNSPATGAPSITGTPALGETLTADTSGISDENGTDDATFTYQWLRAETEITDATGSTYTVVLADADRDIRVRVSFTDDDGYAETATSASVNVPQPDPLTAEFQNYPSSHSGSGTFTMQVRFTWDIRIKWTTFRDDSFTVSGGDVTHANRVNKQRDLWQITVQPDGDEDVTISLAPNRACTTSGAICNNHGMMLSNEPQVTVSGP